MRIRLGGPGDVGPTLALFDQAVAWLVARGLAGQWGTEPFSTSLTQTGQITTWAQDGRLWVAELDGQVVGAIALVPQAPPYVPPADEPELYVHGLVSSRRHAGRGIGAALLDHARAQAAARGVRLLRVDCWAGGNGALVRYYERAGFTPTATFRVGVWKGQVLEDRLTGGPGR